MVSELFPPRDFKTLEDKSLYMQLYRAAGTVYALKEAMWDELAKKMAQEDPVLEVYGWEGDDFQNEQLSRRRFETLFQQYRQYVINFLESFLNPLMYCFFRDMHSRISFWHSLAKSGWEIPPKDRLTPRELAEERHLRRLILDSRKLARSEDFDPPSRIVRLLIGTK